MNARRPLAAKVLDPGGSKGDLWVFQGPGGNPPGSDVIGGPARENSLPGCSICSEEGRGLARLQLGLREKKVCVTEEEGSSDPQPHGLEETARTGALPAGGKLSL